MEKNLLVGNGINIQLGGMENYSNSAIMTRAINNIKMGKYNALAENSLSEAEQLETLEGLVRIINSIKAGGYTKFADALFPRSNEPSGHACMYIWRLPRGLLNIRWMFV